MLHFQDKELVYVRCCGDLEVEWLLPRVVHEALCFADCGRWHSCGVRAEQVLVHCVERVGWCQCHNLTVVL